MSTTGGEARATPSAASRRAIYAASVGSLLEWYDFAVYAYLATVIAARFFPGGDPNAALLATFATFGAGFLARPVGGYLAGRLGDAKGRKVALMWTMFPMALSTIAIGLLPTFDHVGLWAPVMLFALRLAQGLAAGGEWAPAAAFLIEWAPPGRRGFYGSFQQISIGGGLLLGSAVAAVITTLLGHQQMLDWGWRVPFLLSFALLVAGFYIRRHVDETPQFFAARETPRYVPVAQRIRLGAKAFGFSIFWTIASWALVAWVPTFAQKYVGLSPSSALWSNTIGMVAMVATTPLWGALSDRVGRRPILLASTISIGLLAWPLLAAMMRSGGSFWVVMPIQVLLGVLMALFSGTAPAAISEIFPTHLRTTWMAVGYTLATAVFGGFTPFMATWLIRQTGSPLAPSYLYLLPAALVSSIVILAMKETGGRGRRVEADAPNDTTPWRPDETGPLTVRH
jgi:MHS family proline/betaine transporter-like MFS transporter